MTHEVRGAEAAPFFDAIARRYDRVYALSGEESKRRLAKVVALLIGKRRVLVLGVGTGRELSPLLDAGHEVSGLDCSAEMIALCNRRARSIPITLGDFWAPLPFNAEAFDAVLALHGTLAHPPQADSVAVLLAEVARVLAPGGVFVAEVPRPEYLERLSRERDDARSVSPIGGDTFVHTDEVSRASIEGRVFPMDRWEQWLAPHLEPKLEPLGDVEALVVGQKRHTP